jgi:hypothetical protein
MERAHETSLSCQLGLRAEAATREGHGQSCSDASLGIAVLLELPSTRSCFVRFETNAILGCFWRIAGCLDGDRTELTGKKSRDQDKTLQSSSSRMYKEDLALRLTPLLFGLDPE